MARVLGVDRTPRGWRFRCSRPGWGFTFVRRWEWQVRPGGLRHLRRSHGAGRGRKARSREGSPPPRPPWRRPLEHALLRRIERAGGRDLRLACPFGGCGWRAVAAWPQELVARGIGHALERHPAEAALLQARALAASVTEPPGASSR